MYIYKFIPYLKSVIWGGNKIASCKGIDSVGEPIGESWEISGLPGFESVVCEGSDRGLQIDRLIDKYKGALVGEKVYAKFGNLFPLLIKIIDAADNLSVQVHPDDEMARRYNASSGKTEMWYVLETAPGAKIYAGLSKEITPEDYDRMIADETIMDVVSAYDSSPGDVFYLPAGRIHSIGAGNLLAEIQQPCDITYRVFDFGRCDSNGKPRQLHTRQAREAIDYRVCGDGIMRYDRSNPLVSLVDSKCFDVMKLSVDGDTVYDNPYGAFMAVFCTSGTLDIVVDGMEPCSIGRYESALIPAVASRVTFKGHGEILIATMHIE